MELSQSPICREFELLANGLGDRAQTLRRKPHPAHRVMIPILQIRLILGLEFLISFFQALGYLIAYPQKLLAQIPHHSTVFLPDLYLCCLSPVLLPEFYG
jgi:hypothetical protein